MGDRTSDIYDLQSRWRSDTGLTDSLNAALDRIGFTEDYIGSLNAASMAAKRKHIKDSVWGMIEFGAYEMRLIDSPLLQRLRSIKQLGFSYLTYPSAEHSRFVHSLGIGHVVSRFIESIDRDRTGEKIIFSKGVVGFHKFEALDPLTPRELRFAALLHDIGHMPFSHATEFALKSRPEDFSLGGAPLQGHLEIANEAIKNRKGVVPLSELLSIMIVLSQRFEDFYRKIDPEGASSTQSLARIACLIAGIQASDQCPNIQEIISAWAVDADKIDYVARDAKACGISVGVDVARIFLGGGLLSSTRSAYDDAYQGTDEVHDIFVVNSSGADTLDEIVQARSALYQRVYLHPVTRTAEALMARALNANATAGDKGDPELADAISLWAIPDVLLLDRLTHANIDEVKTLSIRIRNRQLPKKACAFAPRLTEMQVRLKSQFSNMDDEVVARIEQHTAHPFIEQLKGDRISEIGVSELEDGIRSEATQLADRIRRAGKAAPDSPLEILVMTPLAAMDADQPDALVFQNGGITRTHAFTNIQGQSDAYDIFKAIGFVFSDPSWREIVLHAARKVIYEESIKRQPALIRQRLYPRDETSSVSFQQQTILDLGGTIRRSNLNPVEAERVLKAAGQVGYFDNAPLLAERTSPDDQIVRKVASCFETFDGENGWRVKPRTVSAFADQFPPDLRAPLLHVLAKGRFLGQRELQAAVRQAVIKVYEQHPGPIVMVPLSPSSGGAVHASIKDGMPNYVRHAHSPGDALAEEDDSTLLFVDDNAASGIQSSAQLHSFSGIEPIKWPQELARETGVFSPLSPDEWNRLSERRFGVVVAAGADAAARRLAEAAASLKLKNFVGLTSGETIGGGLVWPRDLERHLRAIGLELIAQREFGADFAELKHVEEREFCETRSFGYGSGGGVMATWVNVPSSTVTALWQPGFFQGRPWVPLLLRRGRFSELVLC